MATQHDPSPSPNPEDDLREQFISLLDFDLNYIHIERDPSDPSVFTVITDRAWTGAPPKGYRVTIEPCSAERPDEEY